MVEEGTVEELRLELGEKAKMIEKLKCDGVEKAKMIEKLKCDGVEMAKMIEKLKCDGVEMEHKLSWSMVEMERLKISLEAAESKVTELCDAQEKARGILIKGLGGEIPEKLEEGV
ncbi:uncharacterized protein LOC115997406 [Ipomoea triloba]|uniref:uncharacterized protein LOC115997406 n=1 Tax=Ipomoea triloba TaxID=35885 RepID=UPI00125CF463|nr:uncharacterized protein LOC115997406 [Ipomoea triloba]